MPKLTLIRGLPGSGKSTMARKMLEDGTADYHFEADMYHTHNGQYHYNPDNAKLAHLWCECETLAALEAGCNVVVSNTFTRMLELQPYLDLKYETEILTARGNYGSIHGVPDEVINRMRERWEE